MQESRFVIGAVGAAIAIVSFIGSLQTQSAVARFGLDPVGVNRTLKGDRPPVAPGPSGENPAPEPPLPKGCELRFSSVRNAYANEVAGRCLAEERTQRASPSAA